jgi:hypothetical protein
MAQQAIQNQLMASRDPEVQKIQARLFEITSLMATTKPAAASGGGRGGRVGRESHREQVALLRAVHASAVFADRVVGRAAVQHERE